jgi:hypothetical protein
MNSPQWSRGHSSTALTQQEERHGLLAETATIGTRAGREDRLAESGFRLVSRRLMRRHDQQYQDVIDETRLRRPADPRPKDLAVGATSVRRGVLRDCWPDQVHIRHRRGGQTVDFHANDYYRAGLERMRQARLLYQSGDNFALAMCASGLAVECILRAFKWRRDPTFDGRHDLLRLFRESGILRLDEDRLQATGLDPIQLREAVVGFRGAMNSVVLLWANDYRFASERQVRGRLVKMGLHEGKKGDPLKANALSLLNAAQKALDEGVALWTSGKK